MQHSVYLNDEKKFVDPRLLYDILRGLQALWGVYYSPKKIGDLGGVPFFFIVAWNRGVEFAKENVAQDAFLL